VDGDGLVFVRAAERSPSDRTPSRPVLEARPWTVKGSVEGRGCGPDGASSSREPCLAWRRLGPSRAPSDEYVTTREVGQAVAPRATGSAAYSARSNRSWGSADSGGHRNRRSPISSIGFLNASRLRGRSL